MKENILIPAGTESIDIETIVKINPKVIIPNKPPVVSIVIPSNIELPATLTLRATATDSDGFVASYLWTKTSGPAAVISKPDEPLTDVTGLEPGFYEFNLKVTDDKGAVTNIVGNTTVKAAVVIPPVTDLSPVVKAGTDISIKTNYTILRGTAAPGEGKTIESYLWSHVSGPSVYSIHNPTSPDCGFGDLGEGVHVFRLTATDNTGLVGTDEVSVTVNIEAVEPPPVVIPPVVIPPPSDFKYLQLARGEVKTYNGIRGLTIQRQSFFNQDSGLQNGNCLWFNNCHDINIIDCYFGSSKGVAIYAYGCSNIRVFNSLNAYTKGFVNASTCTGGIHIKNSEMFNGYGSGAPYEGKDGNLYKLTECRGPGYGVENCRVENFPGESNPEDIVSLFASEGVQGSPILIKGNLIRGGGPSQSGGGVVAGDGTNSFTGGWVDILDNALLNPGQYGLAAAGGHDINIGGNRIYAEQKPWTNNPLFVWNQYSPVCTRIKVWNNYVNWTDRAGNKNNGWNAGNCSATIFEVPKPITLKEMNAVIPAHLITFLTPDELLKVRAAK